MSIGISARERNAAAITLIAVMGLGILAAVVGDSDLFRFQGWVAAIYCLIALLALVITYREPLGTSESAKSYYDAPTKVGVVIALVWAIAGFFVGDWVAWLLVYPDLTFDSEWFSFGRLRPVHTSGVIFGFGGNALIATSFHVMQRTSRARMPDQFSPWFVLVGYNLFCVLAATG